MKTPNTNGAENDAFPAKWAFVGKSAMTFSQILFTIGLGSQFFKDFSIPWRIAFSSGIIVLTTIAVIVYPDSRKRER